MAGNGITAPGWLAIDAALARIYGAAKPAQYYPATPPPYLGGPPLQGVSVYRSEQEAPHWHFVTYGFTELYQKTSKRAARSGFGFELTFRLRRSPGEETPPAWAVNLLQNLARYVFSTRKALAPGQSMPLRGPIALGNQTRVQALLFVPEPQLGLAETPNGRFSFLQAVGITEDELKAIECWSGSGMAEVMGRQSPLYLTDLARRSCLENPRIARHVAERTEKEGSSLAAGFVGRVEWQMQRSLLGTQRVRVFLGATAVETLLNALQSRIRLQRPFTLMGSGARSRLLVETGDKPGWSTDGDTLRLTLDAAAQSELATLLRPQHGTTRVALLPRVEWWIEASENRDSTGKSVGTIG